MTLSALQTTTTDEPTTSAAPATTVATTVTTQTPMIQTCPPEATDQCTARYKAPVCSPSNGKEYVNMCFASCNNVKDGVLCSAYTPTDEHDHGNHLHLHHVSHHHAYQHNANIDDTDNDTDNYTVPHVVQCHGLWGTCTHTHTHTR